MCLNINKQKHRSKTEYIPLIADKNITCYKTVQRFIDDPKGIYRAEYQTHFKYEVGKLYHSEFRQSYASIEQGLHSYRTLEKAIDIMIARGTGVHILKCVIPKGSQYFIGDNNKVDYASSALKVVKRLTREDIREFKRKQKTKKRK